MTQFVIANKGVLLLAAYLVASVVVAALPDDLRDFDWRTYVPTVLKGIAATVSKKHSVP